MTVVELEHDDDAALEELLAFAADHGTPRATTAAAYRDLMRETAVWAAFVAREAGDVRAVALATISAAIGLDQVQLNAFLVPGAHDAFDAVLARVDEWARERAAVAVTAHVSAPSSEVLEAWTAMGFEQVGERTRVALDLTAADAQRPAVALDGLEITSMAARPDLRESGDALWRIGLDDVPSALRFTSDGVPSLADEIEAVGDRGHAILAVDPDGQVVGLALLIRSIDPTVAGHRMTATAREWRGRGVAHALKVEAIRWAAANGVTRLQASNDSGNAPMHAVNARLGYEPEYRLVLMRRAITPA